jgi:amidase
VAPVARGAGGLPIGVQIVGPYLNDRTPLAVAAWLEARPSGIGANRGFPPWRE